jgi:hypothetical protein
MFVWELVSCRLRTAGWAVWHSMSQDAHGPIYRVHLERRGISCQVSGPTLTEAYATAARRAREQAEADDRGGEYRREPAMKPILAGV